MGLFDNARDWLLAPILENDIRFNATDPSRLDLLTRYKQYVRGVQQHQLPVKTGKPDDNLIVNKLKKVIRKSVSLLFGGEVVFDLEDEAQKEQLDAIWEINKKAIWLKKLGRTGGIAGTHYAKILPDEYGDNLHRLVSLDPMQMEIITDPQDIETVIEYRQTWAVFERSADGEVERSYLRRERTKRLTAEEDGQITYLEAWEIVLQEKSRRTGDKWEDVSTIAWAPEGSSDYYSFPPIIHGQNLPIDDSPYGESDLEDLIPIQDSLNYIVSNIKKIIRHHAHPKTVVTGGSLRDAGSGKSSSDPKGGNPPALAADTLIEFQNPEAKVYNLEMESDLVSSMAFLNFLVESLYDLSDTVNIATIKDKLGQLTNFGLKVLYKDAIDKLQDKRDLYGAFLEELNWRMLALIYGEDAIERGSVKIVWPSDVMPQDDREESEVVIQDIEAGLVSKETGAKLRGYDYEQEQTRLAEERQAEDNLGGELLRRFVNGG